LRESEGERERGRERERERVRPLLVFSRPFVVRTYARMFVCSSLHPPPPPCPFVWGPGHPFYRRKEMPNCTMGCSWELTWLAGKCPEPCIDNNMAVRGRLESCRGSIMAVGEVP
jgi:hypothetical protein